MSTPDPLTVIRAALDERMVLLLAHVPLDEVNRIWRARTAAAVDQLEKHTRDL
jgi:hypothetical protein